MKDFDLFDAPVDDYGLLDIEGAPQFFQDFAEGREWYTHEDLMYTASYKDIIKQINEFTGPKGYAIGVKNAKRRDNDGDLIK